MLIESLRGPLLMSLQQAREAAPEMGNLGTREHEQFVEAVRRRDNDFIVQGCGACAASVSPRVNAAYRDGAVETFERVNVGVAVAAEETLLVPTVFDADSKAVAEIAQVARTLAARARDGSITPAEAVRARRSRSRIWGCSGSTASRR